MLKTMKALVAKTFAAYWAWALRHEQIGSYVSVTIMGLIFAGIICLLNFFLVA